MCSSGAEFASLFESAVSAMKDEVDEVVSTSVHAVSSLFANDRIQLEDKNRLVGEVMEIVWIMLMEGDAEVCLVPRRGILELLRWLFPI